MNYCSLCGMQYYGAFHNCAGRPVVSVPSVTTTSVPYFDNYALARIATALERIADALSKST